MYKLDEINYVTHENIFLKVINTYNECQNQIYETSNGLYLTFHNENNFDKAKYKSMEAIGNLVIF